MSTSASIRRCRVTNVGGAGHGSTLTNGLPPLTIRLPDLPRSGLLSLTFGGDAGHERGRTARGSYGDPVRPGPPATTGGSMG